MLRHINSLNLFNFPAIHRGSVYYNGKVKKCVPFFLIRFFFGPGKPSEKLRYSLVKGDPPVPLTWYLFT